MRTPRPRLLVLTALLLALACLCSGPARAADDEGYNAAAYLLRQAAEPHQDGRHNVLLRGLRMLDDPDLLPFFRALAASPYPPQRVHGLMGMAELSPQRQLDLAALAEVEDPREMIEVLSAAIDDKLVDNAGLSAVLRWDALELPVKQAVALRLIASGGSADTSAFHASLDIKLADDTPAAKQLQYGLAALILAQQGDAQGVAALNTLAGFRGPAAEAVIGQVVDASMAHKLESAGPLAVKVAGDPERDPALRLRCVQAALRHGADGAAERWRAMWDAEPEAARRVRLALIALDSAARVEPRLFGVMESDEMELIRVIGEAGRSMAGGRGDLTAGFAPLIATGHPVAVRWVVAHCQTEEPAQAPDLLLAVIRTYVDGRHANANRLAPFVIEAVNALCEIAPDRATRALPKLLDDPADDERASKFRRQAILLGIARARQVDLSKLAVAIGPDDLSDRTSETLRLVVRARYGAPLTTAEWAHIRDAVQGVGQVEAGLRIQLAWFYLEHLGRGNEAIASVK